MVSIQQFTYLAALLFSLGGLATLDFKWRLVLGSDLKNGLRALGVGVAFFLTWDLLAVHMSAFAFLPSAYTTHIELGGITLEEVLFLVLLCYQTLILWELHARSKERPKGLNT